MLEEIARGRCASMRRRATPFVLLDAAAGKGYVGLLAAKLVLEPRGRPDARVITLEREPDRAALAAAAAQALETPVAIDVRKGDWVGRRRTVAPSAAAGDGPARLRAGGRRDHRSRPSPGGRARCCWCPAAPARPCWRRRRRRRRGRTRWASRARRPCAAGSCRPSSTPSGRCGWRPPAGRPRWWSCARPPSPPTTCCGAPAAWASPAAWPGRGHGGCDGVARLLLSARGRSAFGQASPAPRSAIKRVPARSGVVAIAGQPIGAAGEQIGHRDDQHVVVGLASPARWRRSTRAAGRGPGAHRPA